MQETKVLYTANGGERVRIPRWVDALTFVGVVLAIGVVLGGAVSSGDPTALLFVQIALWVMSATIGIFVLMLLINGVGWWGLLGLIPVVLLAIFWASGIVGNAVVRYWVEGLSRGAFQAIEYSLYGFAGLAGLGLLARVMEKVGVMGFLMTLAGAVGLVLWMT
jgi:hypothetical protein